MDSVVVTCTDCGAKNKIPETKQHLNPRCGKCKKPIDMAPHAVPVHLTDADMDAFLQAASLPVLVDFFSPTCGPCQALAPQLDRLAGEFLGRLIIAKVDTSRNPGCAAHFQIRGVPTLLVFRNGVVVDQLVGLPEPSHLRDKLNYWAQS